MIFAFITLLQKLITFFGSKYMKIPDNFNGEEVPNEVSFPKEDTLTSVSVKNYINVLPWHPYRRWSVRPLTCVNKIIIHQAASKGTVENVNLYHITPSSNNHIDKKGAPHICYHYVISRTGDIYKVNSLTHIVWHCKEQNTSSIGILILGNFSGPSYLGSQEPTIEQLHSLKKILDIYTNAQKNFEGLTINKNNIFGHKDFGKENCPGNILYNFLKNYKTSGEFSNE